MADTITAIGEIIDFDLHLVEGIALSASLEIKVGDDYIEFGGPNLFASIPNEGADVLGHFVMRCFQICEVGKGRDLEGHLIKVEVGDDRIVGICSLRSEEFFYPVLEFERLR
ncbi:hypothetical protein GCM10007423_63980 [Dyadobacter endophyticus]|uniref:Uncharacterized protein n=1 Tax=Dyadobacter endophyticus TaxID=1749036 RepID=A0ABQ1ZDQ3_9BACT|nr:hypothetical protein [Dyadobacter endophyticus]GGH55924.1 hypothetical protein GCM10007423_63980 [Dyadobacter endophyticus]